jgi:hypothetical protein
MPKYLYHIWQTENGGYDTYDGAIVCAETPEKARWTHPSDYIKEWDGKSERYDSWANIDNVHVDLIGTADESVPLGIVLASFNAG